jgi:hypothetical protein
LTPVVVISQIACGIWLCTSFISGTARSYGKVMSNLPAVKANTAVDGFLMIMYSTPSR